MWDGVKIKLQFVVLVNLCRVNALSCQFEAISLMSLNTDLVKDMCCNWLLKAPMNEL